MHTFGPMSLRTLTVFKWKASKCAIAISVTFAVVSSRRVIPVICSFSIMSAVQFPVISKINMRLLSILDKNDVDQRMQSPLGKFGATTPGFVTVVASGKKGAAR